MPTSPTLLANLARVVQRLRVLGGEALLAGVALGVVAATPARAHAPNPNPTPGPVPALQSSRAIVSLSVVDGRVVALRETGDGHLELLIGTSAELTAAPGVMPFDGKRTNVPRVHAGTDAAGRAVVTYPRCTTTGKPSAPVRNCDLRIYDVASGAERLLSGVRRPGRDEYEAVMDGGALLYSAYGRTGAAGEAGQGLWYRPAGGRDRRIARNPGRDLALRGDRIAQVITDGSKDAGEEPCENSTLVLRSTRGAPRLVARDCVFPYGYPDVWTSPSFVGNGLFWARLTSRGPNLFRLDLRTRRVREARVKVSIFGFQATGPDAGLALVRTDDAVVAESDWAAANAVVPLDTIAWTPRKKTLIKEVPHVEDNPLA